MGRLYTLHPRHVGAGSWSLSAQGACHIRESLTWFGVWTGLALVFNILIVLFHERGGQAGLEFFTGYLVEKSLSVDNIFVFLLIFNYFRVPPTYPHKVLF